MNPNLAFYKAEDKAQNINFECVIGHGISHNFPFHIHLSLCIGLITKGTRQIVFSENKICVKENELFVINPLQPHAIQQEYPHDYAIITVKGLSNCPIFNQHIQSVQCKQLFLNLLDAMKGCEDKELTNHWEKLFAYLCQHQSEKSDTMKMNTIVEKTIAYVSENYQNTITVNELATYNCMSVFHYCRLFKSLTGISPHKYLIQYRLSMSRKFLQEKELIFGAAIDSGFYDSSHFIHNFHNYMALSPSSYRQSIIENSKNIQ